jgi:plastocyanin
VFVVFLVLALVGIAAPTSASPIAAQPAATVTVSIRDNFFSPRKRVVKPGTKVTWRNDGDVRHSATAFNGSFDTNRLAPGSSRSFTFRKLGKYRYFCKVHDGMTGVVKVCVKRNGKRVCKR